MADETRPIAARLRDILAELEAMPEPEPSPVASPLITEARLAELSGYTVRGLEGLRVRGEVTEGVHYFRSPTRKIGWDTKAFNAWQRGVPDQAIRESRSGQAAA